MGTVEAPVIICIAGELIAQGRRQGRYKHTANRIQEYRNTGIRGGNSSVRMERSKHYTII